MRCEPVVLDIYSVLRHFLHLGAPIILAVSLALFRSVAGRELNTAQVVPAVRQNAGTCSGAGTGFRQTPVFSRTLLRAFLLVSVVGPHNQVYIAIHLNITHHHVTTHMAYTTPSKSCG